MKLNDVYNKWLSVKRRQVKESTLSCYQLIYIKILAPRFGSTDVETMNKKVVKLLSMLWIIHHLAI